MSAPDNRVRPDDPIFDILALDSYHTTEVVYDDIDRWITARFDDHHPENHHLLIIRSSRARVSVRTVGDRRYLLWDKEFFARYQQLLQCLFIEDEARRLWWARSLMSEMSVVFLLDQRQVLSAMSLIKAAVQGKFFPPPPPDPNECMGWEQERFWLMANAGRVFAYFHEEAHSQYLLHADLKADGIERAREYLNWCVEILLDLEHEVQGNKANYVTICLILQIEMPGDNTDFEGLLSARHTLVAELRNVLEDPGMLLELACDIYAAYGLMYVFRPASEGDAADYIEGVALLFETFDFLETLRSLMLANAECRRSVVLPRDEQSGLRNALRRIALFNELIIWSERPGDFADLGQKSIDVHCEMAAIFGPLVEHIFEQMNSWFLLSGSMWESCRAQQPQISIADFEDGIERIRDFFMLADEPMTQESVFSRIMRTALNAETTILSKGDPRDPPSLKQGFLIPTSIRFDQSAAQVYAIVERNRRAQEADASSRDAVS